MQRDRSSRRRRAVTAIALAALSSLGHVAIADEVSSVIGAPATATARAERLGTVTTRGGRSASAVRFETLPPGTPLPSEVDCAARVRPLAELRPANTEYNAARGAGTTSRLPRVTGDFTGTTDEILQWVACKWGIDEDIVRAQIAKESWWNQSAAGDMTSDPTLCHPSLRTTMPCAESVGLGQVRFRHHGAAFSDDDALRSSAYNVDYTYSVWRECFEGRTAWLHGVERGAAYIAGDAWGCVGVWFAGRWYTDAARRYISSVQEYVAERVWERPSFANG
jgi:hypothetical protein